MPPVMSTATSAYINERAKRSPEARVHSKEMDISPQKGSRKKLVVFSQTPSNVVDAGVGKNDGKKGTTAKEKIDTIGDSCKIGHLLKKSALSPLQRQNPSELAQRRLVIGPRKQSSVSMLRNDDIKTRSMKDLLDDYSANRYGYDHTGAATRLAGKASLAPRLPQHSTPPKNKETGSTGVVVATKLTLNAQIVQVRNKTNRIGLTRSMFDSPFGTAAHNFDEFMKMVDHNNL